MTRLEKLLRRFGVMGSGRQRTADVFLDIGSHTTKLLIGESLTIHPTCFVQHQASMAVLAVGDQALKMLGKLPEHTRVVFPVRFGKVQDQVQLELFVQSILQDSISQGIQTFFSPHRLHLAVLHPEQSAQHRAWEQSLKSWGRVMPVQSCANAIWQSVRNQHLFTGDGCVIDIGAMTTKFYMYTNGNVVSQKILECGGDTWTHEVMQALRRESQLEVGWVTAEYLKTKAIQFERSSQKHSVQGKDLVTGLPTTRVIDEDVFAEKKHTLLKQLVEVFQQLSQQSSPELVAKVRETGVYLTGGGSRIKGLAKHVEQALKLPVHASRFPQRDVVQGLSALRSHHEKAHRA